MADLKMAHPSPDRLAAFQLKRLSEPEAVAVEGHLAACASCRHLLEALPAHSLETILRLASIADTPPASEHAVPNPAEALTGPPGPSPSEETANVPSELAGHPRYRILGPLGAGGMGCVYKAEHRLMERLVAIKVINQAFTREHDAIERFRREVKAAARLAHPNIVAAHDAEQAGELHFLVMEYVEGTDLAHLVFQKGKLPVPEACEYVRQAGLGLQHAFERGMVHRDIKPQNLMVTPEGVVKILDFGLARFAAESSAPGALTLQGTVMGTPDYIAPEQARDARTADIRADIYSLGCTLYFLLTGQAPFPEGSVLQKLVAHADQTPRSITEFRNDLPAGLILVLQRMMAKLPGQRYQTPNEVAQALAPFAGASPHPEMMDAIPFDEGDMVLPSAVPIDSPTVPQPLHESVSPDAEWKSLPGLRPASPSGSRASKSPSSRRIQSGPGSSRPQHDEGDDPDDFEPTQPRLRHGSYSDEYDAPVGSQADQLPMGALGLGITSLVLGIIAALVSWIPCMGVLIIPVSVIGLLLGGAGTILSLFQRGRGLGFCITGTVLNLVALALAISITYLIGYLFPASEMHFGGH